LEVVELLSTVIEHLVKGEIMQMKPSTSGRTALEYYLRKNFYKTASLMGHSCLAAAVLGQYPESLQRACYLYGCYVGQAFQLVDDALDFEGSTSVLGKAPLADLKSGLATAPTLFAAEEYPQLLSLIGRKFELPGDVDEALSLVQRSQGLKRCRELAQVHAEKAIESILLLGPSPARDSLVALACKVVTRSY
jgi:geranylgeranyl pyrophosphate synthase